jgi:hypothetical protein
MELIGTIPDTPARLRELLLMIFDGRLFLRFAGVNPAAASLDVVWRDEAAQEGYRSVYVPLKRDRLCEAQRLVELGEQRRRAVRHGRPPADRRRGRSTGLRRDHAVRRPAVGW